MDKTLALTLLVQLVLPLAVGLVTKKSHSANLKFVLLAALTAVNATCVGLLGGAKLTELLLNAGVGLAASLGAHYGIYKPVGASEVVQNTLVKDAPVEEVHDGETPVQADAEAGAPTEADAGSEETEVLDTEQATDGTATEAEGS